MTTVSLTDLRSRLYEVYASRTPAMAGARQLLSFIGVTCVPFCRRRRQAPWRTSAAGTVTSSG